MIIRKILCLIIFAFYCCKSSAIDFVLPDDQDYRQNSNFLDPVRVFCETSGVKNLDLTIAVGRGGLIKAIHEKNTSPILAVFIWSNTYHSILVKSDPKFSHPISAIFADPDPQLQIELAKRILGSKETLGTLISDYSSPAATRLVNGSLKVNLSKFEPSEIIRSLNSATKNTAGLLAIPDPEIFNSETSGPIIESLFEQKKAVIGYSPAFVDSGALATVYSDPSELSRQIIEIINTFRLTGKLPKESFPKYFNVKINDKIARWLNLPAYDPVKLKNEIEIDQGEGKE